MLEQKTQTESLETSEETGLENNTEEPYFDYFSIDQIIEKTERLEEEEYEIDEDYTIYLITWCPDPSETPDADFQFQHNTNVNVISDYLKCCKCGAFCVESTQMGNPHYHGWYQVDDDWEKERIAMIKTLKRFGIVKITPLIKYKPFSFREKCNGLYYYKKDLLGAMFAIDNNPIFAETREDIEIQKLITLSFFDKRNKGRKSLDKVKDKLSDLAYYKKFYGGEIDI